jgi:flagellar hook assembly protein FlgD
VELLLPSEAEVSIEVYDVAGRKVTTLDGGVMPAGSHTLAWAGCDTLGRAATSGVYFLRVRTDHETLSRRVVLIK